MSKSLEQIIEELKKPFNYSDVQAKIQATTNDKTKGLAVFYISSRAIQNRLDEVVGPFNWRNEYLLWQNNAQICGISIYDESRSIWVTKYDGAENTDIEPIKGGLSDSLKRAAVMWGLGRYLYNVEGKWVEIEQKGKSSIVKASESKNLENYYNKIVFGSNSGTKENIASTSSGSHVQQANSTGQQAANQAIYDYKVLKTTVTGNSTCVTLGNKEGKEIQAYAPKDSIGLKPGTLIKNAQFQKKEADFGPYYTLDNYELAA